MKLIDTGRYLPTFMRDFHDQKDIFKAVHWWGKNSESRKIGWIDAHCYVIDIFLGFMALHGYTLQKTRTKECTYEIQDTINVMKKESENILKEFFSGDNK